jgi:LmbE family N-acetylglucosaminyl deacetylase
MVRLSLNHSNGAPFRILCLGAHCDDIEIGCGGTLLKLQEEKKNVEVEWVVFSSDAQRAKETRRAAGRFLEAARSKKVEAKAFRDTFFPFVGSKIKEHFRRLQERVTPDLIFTHFRGDLHQDHRVISELTWNAFRDHLILEYEIPKYDGDLGSPNVFVSLDGRICRQKIDYLMESYPSQRTKQWFTEETFLATLRLRGVESNSPTKYAEGFYCRKMAI